MDILDPTRAIAIMKDDPPDLILMDIVMPKMDGYQLCKELKRVEVLRHIPVVFLTSHNTLEEIQNCFNVGAIDVIGKPFQPLELRARVGGQIRLLEQNAHIQSIQAQLVHSAKLASLGTLAAGLAHELNNPLMVITGNAEILDKASDISEKHHRHIEKINKSASRMKKVIYHMVDFAREGRLDDLREVAILEIIQESIYFLEKRLLLNSIELNMIEPTQVPAIRGNLTHLVSIFQNLITNSIDAFQDLKDGRHKKIQIEVMAEMDHIEIIYADNATGMSEEQMKHIFDPFYTTKAPGKGTGLGMSITYNIVKNHGGKLLVESKDGEWTKFILKFPTVPELDNLSCYTLDDGSHTPDGKPIGFTKDIASLKIPAGLRLLIVDDELEVAEVLEEFLNEHFEVNVSTDPYDALRIISKEKFDLILTDMKMPGVSGLDIVKCGRKFQDNIPILIISGSPRTDANVNFALSQGASDMLSKPVDQEELLSSIAYYLSK